MDNGTVVVHYLLRNATSLLKVNTAVVPIMYKVIDFSCYNKDYLKQIVHLSSAKINSFITYQMKIWHLIDSNNNFEQVHSFQKGKARGGYNHIFQKKTNSIHTHKNLRTKTISSLDPN